MTLEILWFWVICVLWTGYFVLEGFDFGVGALLPWLGRDETERGTMFKSIGPFWDANEVWLIVAAGATFAAFPVWYATMFSGLYLLLLAILVLLIIRVLSFEWRERTESPVWRGVWMWTNTIGSIGAPLLWGIGLSNLLHGLPINAEQAFTGNFGDLFSGYSVLAGIAFVALFTFHGAVYLTIRTVGELRERARSTAARLGPVAAVIGAAFLVWTVVVAVDANDKGALPSAVIVALAAIALIVAIVAVRAARDGVAFTATAAAILLAIVTLFTGLYPRVMVSSTDFANSLTIENASSANYTLTVITVVAGVLVPVVLLYQGWTYHVFRARVGGRELPKNPLSGGSPRPLAQPGDGES